MFKSYQFDGSLAMSSCHRSVSSRGQDQRHPLPKPSWHLHGAASRTDLIFVGARRKRWSALRVGGGRKGHAGRLDRVDSGQWVKIEGSTSGGFVESTLTVGAVVFVKGTESAERWR